MEDKLKVGEQKHQTEFDIVYRWESTIRYGKTSAKYVGWP